jgi:pimeloyl-ACP methyl ester carboxylesterase
MVGGTARGAGIESFHIWKTAATRVIARDLPRHGRDKTSTAKTVMRGYVEAVVAQLDSLSEPAYLVGHSSGGAIVTQVAEYRPEKIRVLVSALLPRNGESILGLFQQASESLLLRSVMSSDEQNQLTVPDGALRKCFYAGCSDHDVALAKSCLVSEPLAPAITPIETTPGNFGRVPRVYIETLRDEALPVAFQRRMYSTLPCRHDSDDGYRPFTVFSAPGELVGHLTSL